MSTFLVLSHFLCKFKPFLEFSFQNLISNLSLHEASVCVCGCVHPLNKDVSQATIGTFFLCFLQKMAAWVAFEVSIRFMLANGQCLFLSYCDFCSVCEKSLLTGKALNAI